MAGSWDHYLASGWEHYFTELSSFVDISRHESSVNDNLAEYIIDRLEMCIVNLSSLVHHIQVYVPKKQAW